MNKTIFPSVMISSLFALTLVGCGGGGGGGNDSAAPPPVSPGEQMIAQDATYESNGVVVTSVTAQPVTTNATATISRRTDGTIQAITITTPTTTVSWDEANGTDIIDDTDVVVTAENATSSDIGIIINADDPNINWKYQTFGVWETGRETANGTFGAATVSLLPSTGSAIPTTGTATFTGLSGGVYIDASGANNYITASALSADVNFLNRSIALATTNTTTVDTLTATLSAAPQLDMTGTLTYAAGVNSFKGNVAATGLTGSSTGQFYGPNVEELGGVFSLQGQGRETYIGAYGAKK